MILIPALWSDIYIIARVYWFYAVGETVLYVHRPEALPTETHTTSSTFTITCSTGTNEPAVVTWLEDGKQITLNDNNFKRLTGSVMKIMYWQGVNYENHFQSENLLCSFIHQF